MVIDRLLDSEGTNNKLTFLQLWLALASLCVLDQDHVERLSSGQWVSGSAEQAQPRVSLLLVIPGSLTKCNLLYILL